MYEEQTPNINEENGEWIFNHYDIECLSIGAGILGCGGGGNPLYGKLWAHKLLDEGKSIRVINPKRFHKNSTGIDYSVPCGFMGAPTVLNEMLLSSDQASAAIHGIKHLWTNAANKFDTMCFDEDLHVETGEGIKYLSSYRCDTPKADNGKKISAVHNIEVGGGNSMTALVIGAEMNLPVLDCDLMGRAFPQLQMCTNTIYGDELYPAALGHYCDEKQICLHADSTKNIENYFRKVLMQFGCLSCLTLRPSLIEDLNGKSVFNSTSRAWKLGQAVLKSRQKKSSCIAAILQFEKGIHICTGKISDVDRKTEGGFATGELKIEGINEFQSQKYKICFQNENVLVEKLSGDTYEVQASVPDLICIVDTETGEAVPTDELRYGLRIAVLVLPAPPLYKTPKALAVVGPAAFGYSDVTYKAIGEYTEHSAIPPE